MWALAPPPGHSLVPSHGDGWKEMASSRWTLMGSCGAEWGWGSVLMNTGGQGSLSP